MFFLAWLLFEDLARKYLGNSMAIYFGKDVFVAVVYLSFFLAHRRREVPWIRPPFLLPLLIMNWFGVIQIFNPGSPRSIVGYGGQLFLGGNLRISGFSTDARLCNARIANCFPSVYSRSRHHRCVDVSSVVLLLGSSSLPSVFVWALG